MKKFNQLKDRCLRSVVILKFKTLLNVIAHNIHKSDVAITQRYTRYLISLDKRVCIYISIETAIGSNLGSEKKLKVKLNLFSRSMSGLRLLFESCHEAMALQVIQ
jgi:hypothetical protein